MFNKLKKKDPAKVDVIPPENSGFTNPYEVALARAHAHAHTQGKPQFPLFKQENFNMGDVYFVYQKLNTLMENVAALHRDVLEMKAEYISGEPKKKPDTRRTTEARKKTIFKSKNYKYAEYIGLFDLEVGNHIFLRGIDIPEDIRRGSFVAYIYRNNALQGRKFRVDKVLDNDGKLINMTIFRKH